MSLQTKPLDASFGVEVLEVDVRDLDDGQIDELQALWREHQVVVLRGQHLDAEEQSSFCARLGPVGEVSNATADMRGAERHVMMIANRAVDGQEGYLPDGEMWFHFDQAYIEVPIRAGILYGIEIPSSGGDTMFANSVAAYDALPHDLQAELDGLSAENVYDYRATTQILSEGEEAAGHVHPVVIRHPDTGRPSLFVSRLMTRRIVDVDEERSRTLLDTIFAHLEDPRFTYRHRWSPLDLLMWDNRSVLHARTDFDPAESRVLRRLSLAGDAAPIGYRGAVASGR